MKLLLVLILLILLVSWYVARIPYEPDYETLEDRLRDLYQEHIYEMRREGVRPMGYAEWKAKYAEMLGEIRDE